MTFTVQSAESLFTPEEQAAHKAYLAEQGARYADRINDAAHNARERIRGLHGEKAAKFFETFALGIKSAEKFVAQKDSDADMQVPGLIPATGSGLHTGASRSFKSFGQIHLGAEVTRLGGKALLIVAEGARGYKRRLRAYAEYHGIALKDMPTVLPMAVNLFEPNEVTAFIEAVRVLYPDVTYVSFDTKWRCGLGAEENSATDQAKVFANVERIAQAFKCFVMLVAHTGKSPEKGVRGSSSQYAAVDVELTQERTGERSCTLTVTKAKDWEDGTAYTFQAVNVDLGGGESSLALEPVDAADVAVSIKPPKGPIERALWDHAQSLGERFTKKALVADVTEMLLKVKPRIRSTTVARSFDGMKDYFIQHGEEYALRAPVVHDNADWL